MRKLIFTISVLFLMLPNTILWAQWQSIGSGISTNPRDIFSISAVNKDVIWAVAYNPFGNSCYDYTVSVDGGVTWNSGLLSDTIGNYYPGNIHAINDQVAWIIMISLPNQGKIKIFKTSNSGLSWQEQTGEFNNEGFAFAAMHFFNSNEGIGFGSPGTGAAAVDSMRIYRTNDGGNIWTRIPAVTLPAPLSAEGVWVYGNNHYDAKGDTLWFFTRKSRVFRTTDKGETWAAFDAGISGNSNYPGISSIAFQNSMQGIVTTYAPSRAAITSDGGETWTQLTIPPTPNEADIEYVPGTYATYIITKGFLNRGTTSQYLITDDGGSTWTTGSFSPPIPILQFLSPTVGFAGGEILSPDSGGIYKWTGDLSDTVTSVNNTLPINFAIDIYPNPAKDKVVIWLSDDLPRQKHLTLNLYSVFGQVVKQVEINSKLTNIELSDLSTGLYFYELRDHQNGLATGKIMKE